MWVFVMAMALSFAPQNETDPIKMALELEPAVIRAYRHAVIKLDLRGDEYYYQFDGILKRSIKPNVAYQVYGEKFSLIRLFRYMEQLKKPLRIDIRKSYMEFRSTPRAGTGGCEGKKVVDGEVWAARRISERRVYVVVAMRIAHMNPECQLLPRADNEPMAVVFAEFDYKAGGIVRSRIFRP